MTQSSDARLRELLAERERRQYEMLRIYRPLPSQLRIFESQAPELIVRGGNRSGKTTSTSVLFASLALGQPIHGLDDVEIPDPWPKHWGKDNLLLWVIGYDERHIGQTLHRHLFKPGLFRVIRDLETGRYRCFRPWDPSDMARSEETIPSEPLIPERYIKSWSWKDKSANVFDTCELVNGTTICAFSSRGEPKQGDKVHCIWIDEDIEYQSHVAEWRMRLLDYRGRLIWTAYPHSKNLALVEMSEQAEHQSQWGKPPIVEEIQLSLMDNPFIGEDQKDRVISTLSEVDQKSRIYGEFSYDSYLVYPMFSKKIHCAPAINRERWDSIDELTFKGERPVGWTRYMAVDPGFSCTAVIFGAVPPPDAFEGLPENEQYLVIEGELYLKNHTIEDTVREMKLWTQGFTYESFVIDWHAARQTPMSGGATIYQQFSEMMAKYGISSNRTGNGFLRGNDDILGRIELVRSYLRINRANRPRLRINSGKSPGLLREFGRYRFREGNHGNTSDRPINRDDHAMDALGYLVSMNPQYIPVSYDNATRSPALQAYQKLIGKERSRLQASNRFVNLGPVIRG